MEVEDEGGSMTVLEHMYLYANETIGDKHRIRTTEMQPGRETVPGRVRGRGVDTPSLGVDVQDERGRSQSCRLSSPCVRSRMKVVLKF